MDLEEVWRIREEEVYPILFGGQVRGIFPLQPEIFTHQFSQSELDPRWLHYGVFEYAPTTSRSCWIYVTSGHSNPWEQEPGLYDVNGDSGSGIEFTMATSEPGDWAIRTLQSMLAFDILLEAGRFSGKGPLGIGDRIPLRAPINGKEACVLRNLIMTNAEGFAGQFRLPSGNVVLAGFTAVSDGELEEAKRTTSESIIDRLREAGWHPVNNPRRRSIV